MTGLAAAKGWLDLLAVLAALVLGLLLLWFVTGEMILVAAYGGGALVLGAVVVALVRRAPEQAGEEFALPDWSVTVSALERSESAMAITDRAGRLVCANDRLVTWFGVSTAPPMLPVNQASLERLDRAARTAWREGEVKVDLLESDAGRWKGEIHRAGRGEDYLIWCFDAIQVNDPLSELVSNLDGKAGRMLANAGIAAAVVDPDGVIRGASSGFAEGAVGDAGAGLAGQDFVSFLQQGEDDSLTWKREGKQGTPLTLFYVPIADPDIPGEPDPDMTPALMLLVASSVGIGGGSGESTAAVPHLEALLGQLPLGLAMANRDGRLLFANTAFMRAAGREGEKPPIYPTDLVTKDDKGALSDAIRRYGQGAISSGDLTIRLSAQPDDPVSLSLAGVRGLGEAAVLLSLNDTTEEIRLKRQVAQATKMQAVGQLAGGVAHDFNNVLTAILGTCDLMLMRHTPGDSDYDDIQQIRANSNRAAALTRQLLAFSRQQTLRPVVLQLPDVVSDISQMLKRLIGEKIQLVVTHDRNLGPVRADPTQLEQVIVNLAVNARDAMNAAEGGAQGEARGTLTLATRRVTAQDVRAMRSDIIPPVDYTALIVSDTGSGIPPEHLGKIFEPFFTTKEQGKGTGLGLSTVYGIVKQSGGFIFADSELGKGTAFTVYLPVHYADEPEVDEEQGQAVEAQPSEWAGGGRILLVEDEAPVRMVAERALARQGYEITTASDGEEGLEFVQDGAEFDLVVSDVVMPSMDGPAMAKEIRKIVSDIPVLFMSGYAEEQLRKELDIENVHFLPKPFTVQQISDKVAEILAISAIR